MISRPSFVAVTVSALVAVPLAGAQELVVSSGRDVQLPAVSIEEQHLQAGVVLLHSLYRVLARVQDIGSARAAVPEVNRISRDLHNWAQGIASLPPLGEDEIRSYEQRYLPVIQRINDNIRTQGERLSASKYFGSQELADALVYLYITAQQ